MEDKVKVLYFVDRMLRGGIQTFVIENMKHMDKNKIQVDYLLLDDGNKYELEDTLIEMGSKIFKLKGIWFRQPFDFIKYCIALNKFFKKHNDYKVVHLHSSSKNFMVLYYAKKYGIKVRIAHSHNIGFQSKNKMQILLGNIFKVPLKKYATDYFACSEIAGEWLFGKKNVKSGKVIIIHNAVDLDKFKFNNEKREKLRKELNIEDTDLVIGNVARFTNQKNHEFLIDIFNEIYKKNNSSKLLLIGTGEKEIYIKEKVNELGLTNDVIFLGFKTNVNDYMNVMDIFLFPSKYEGLGLVLIEAQANGIKCFTSQNVVPLEAKVSDLLEYISLNETSKNWANKVLSVNKNRKNVKEKIIEKGYSIEYTAKKLEQFYFNCE